MRLFLTILIAVIWLAAIFYRSYRRAQRSMHWCEVCADRGIPSAAADGKFLGRWLCASCVNETINIKRAEGEKVVQVSVKRAT